MMAGTQGSRRSGRTRNTVKTYADEQAEEQSTQAAQPAKRKRAASKDTKTIKSAAKATKIQPGNGATAMANDVDGDEPPPKKAKKTRAQAIEDEAEVQADDEDFKPSPAKKKKSSKSKSTKAIGKLDSEGIMRLNTTETRPPGEKRPPQVWDVPKKAKAKAKATNGGLAAIMAESFEDRYEAKVSRIPRLKPGQEECRLKGTVHEQTDSYNTFLQRASTQRMYVLSRNLSVEGNCHAGHEDCPVHQVKIAGTTGNVYTVVISHLPSCSCPNTSFKANNSSQALCKHMLYVLHFVLKAPEHLCYQNAFLTSELKELTANAPALPAAVAAAEEAHDGNRKPVEDDCPICCMEFKDDDEITWCKAACGNNIHEECFRLWAQTKRDNVTCPYCRSQWQGDKPAGDQAATFEDVLMPAQRVGGYYNVRDQLAYDV